jgi:hypothetical protein
MQTKVPRPEGDSLSLSLPEKIDFLVLTGAYRCHGMSSHSFRMGRQLRCQRLGTTAFMYRADVDGNIHALGTRHSEAALT